MTGILSRDPSLICIAFAAGILWFLPDRRANLVASWSGFSMPTIPHWSIVLQGPRGRRPRWLSSNGRFSSNASGALRLVCPEVAARRVQQYMELHGWPPEVMDRFRLVPAPALDRVRSPRSRNPLPRPLAA